MKQSNKATILIILITILIILLIMFVASNSMLTSKPTQRKTNSSGELITQDQQDETKTESEKYAKKLTEADFLQDFESISYEEFKEQNYLDDIDFVKGATLIKEDKDQKKYDEVTIVNCKSEEDAEKVITKLLAKYEKLKDEKGSIYGYEEVAPQKFLLEKTGETTIFILSQEKDTIKKLIIKEHLKN